jgi:hypothetical protein
MRWREWLGVRERRWKKAPDEEVQPTKTLWDWLQLLIVPAILVAVTFAWSARQTSTDNKREDRRSQDATLRGYLDQMSGLMLDKKLLTSKVNDPVRVVARTVTLATLRRLDGERRGQVVRFLQEARLLEPRNLRVDLEGADLRRAELPGAELEYASLYSTDLRDANLRGANLTGADLSGADLRRAHLGGTYLIHAGLAGAVLREADLGQANLRGANLQGAQLSRAHLSGADLGFAVLVGADDPFVDPDAHFAGADLAGARNLDLAKLIAGLPPKRERQFLKVEKTFLDSLSPAELAKFNLTPEKLATFRRQAGGG